MCRNMGAELAGMMRCEAAISFPGYKDSYFFLNWQQTIRLLDFRRQTQVVAVQSFLVVGGIALPYALSPLCETVNPQSNF